MSANSGAPSVALRVHIFVDFWNFQLSLRDLEPAFPIDWKALPKVILPEVQALLVAPGALQYQGMNVYGSFAEGPRDEKLKRWANTVLDTFPGVQVRFVERQKRKSAPKCPVCQSSVSICPQCGADMRGTEEKGVDTAIATDMISLAWEGAYDVAVLVSSDRDFVPVAENLQHKGVKVIHGAFPPKGAILSQHCWGYLDLGALRSHFRRS